MGGGAVSDPAPYPIESILDDTLALALSGLKQAVKQGLPTEALIERVVWFAQEAGAILDVTSIAESK